MKNIGIILLFVSAMISCKGQQPKDYVTISGKIAGVKDTISILNQEGFTKKIAVSPDGSFKDTLKLFKKGNYLLQSGKQKFIAFLYLANGYQLNMTADDSTKLPKGIKFTGLGSDSNNFILSQMGMAEKIGNPADLFALDKPNFDKKVKSIKASFEDSYKSYKNADSSLIAQSKVQNKNMFEYIEKQYEKQHPIALKRAEAMKKLVRGNVSPKFVNYENFKGGKMSLSDLKGKYVYIDIWATWCGPCKAEIPHLKKMEEKYHGKNIAFVSISVDRKEDHQKWKKMIVDKKMGGIQLFAGVKDDKFTKDYQVDTIPRFILIDPKGNIVEADAPRPSNPEKLESLFKELGI